MKYRREFEDYRERAIFKTKDAVNRAKIEIKKVKIDINKVKKEVKREVEKEVEKANSNVKVYVKKQPYQESVKVNVKSKNILRDNDIKKNRRQKRDKKSRVKFKDSLSNSVDSLFSLLRFNLTFKLTLNNLLAMIILCLVFSYIFMSSLNYVKYAEKNNEIYTSGTNIVKSIHTMKEIRDDDFKNMMGSFGYQYAVKDSESKIIYSTSNFDLAGIRSYTPMDFILIRAPKYNFFIENKVLDEKQFDILIYKNFNQSSLYYTGFYQLCLGIGVLLIIIYGIWINGITHRTMMPIKTMTRTVQNITIQSLNKRIDIGHTKDELRDLAVTFNFMMDDIQSAYEKQRQFVSDASHELRTPISVIKGYVDLLERWGKNDPDILNEGIDAIKGEAHNMQSLVEKLLFIARSEKGKIEYEMEILDINYLIEAMVSDFEMIDAKHEFKFAFDFDGKLAGNRDAIVQLIRIFVDNSMKYTPEGGTIFIRTKTIDEKLVVEIEDTGIGIEKEDLPRIFDRFFRADKSRTRIDDKGKSFGLGLSIAKIILDAHMAYVIPESEPNVGTKMSIVFNAVVYNED